MRTATQGASTPSGARPAAVIDRLVRGTTRGALFVGFGLIFVLWMVSGVDLVQRVVEAEQRVSAVNARVAVASDLILTIRTQVLLGSIYLRDALLDSPEHAATYRKQLEDARAAVDQALGAYQPVGDSSGEREAIARLRAELAGFWSARFAALDWDADHRESEVRKLLSEGLVPKREMVIRISDGIRDLHSATVQQQRTELADLYGAMRRRVWVTTSIAIVLSAVVALIVTLYADRLEKRIQQQRAHDMQTARDLQRLSARLVTAQEEERRSIARELHDEVGQALTAIRLELAAAESALGANGPALPVLHEVRAITDRTFQSVRELSQLLHPALLDDVGLPAALELHLRHFSARTGIAAELLQEQMDTRLAPEIEICLYRIAQEALTNVARHSRASSCRVYLQRLSSTVLMTVEDNGQGFTPKAGGAAAASHGIGLLGIRERVAGVHGTYRLESTPDKGTRLTVEVPALARAAGDETEGPARRLSAALEGST